MHCFFKKPTEPHKKQTKPILKKSEMYIFYFIFLWNWRRTDEPRKNRKFAIEIEALSCRTILQSQYKHNFDRIVRSLFHLSKFLFVKYFWEEFS